MKKFFKVLGWLVVVLVVAVLAAVFTLPLWISPAVKTAAKVGGPKVLGVEVSVGDVKLSPLSGSMTISKLNVGNPKGYSERPCFAVDKVDVALNLQSLFGDKIIVKQVAIDSPAISFESKNGLSNFDTILNNAKKAEGEEKAKAESTGEKKAGKKVVIETFSLKGAKVSCSAGWTLGKAITLPLPPVTLHDIGKESDGATPIEAVTQVINEIMSALTKAVTGAASATGDLLKSVGSGASDTAKDAVDAAENAAKSAGDAAKGAVKSLKNLFK